MFTFNIHDLLAGKKRKIQINEGIANYLDIWKRCFKATGENPNITDAFVAGYMVGNNVMLKERIINLKKNKELIDKTFGGKNG